MFILYQQCNNERECGMTYIYKKQVLQDNSHNTRNTIFFTLSLYRCPHTNTGIAIDNGLCRLQNSILVELRVVLLH